MNDRPDVLELMERANPVAPPEVPDPGEREIEVMEEIIRSSAIPLRVGDRGKGSLAPVRAPLVRPWGRRLQGPMVAVATLVFVVAAALTVWLVAAITRGDPQVVTLVAAEGTPVPTGKITFSSSRGSLHTNIFVSHADRWGVTQLTDTDRDTEPHLSADGSRIVFVSDRDGNPEIYVMNADGTDQTRLTNTPAGELRPRWSPDGSRIAFISDSSGDLDVYVMNADGTEPTNLTNDPAFDGGATWSPDGQRLTFASDRDGDNFEIYVVNADGTGLSRITDDPRDDAGPAWSPDGGRIAFFSGSFESRQYGLFVINADGSQRTRLADSNGHLGFFPAWSPDGHWLAYQTQLEGTNHEVFLVAADGTELINITNHPAADGWPSWSP